MLASTNKRPSLAPPFASSYSGDEYSIPVAGGRGGDTDSIAPARGGDLSGAEDDPDFPLFVDSTRAGYLDEVAVCVSNAATGQTGLLAEAEQECAVGENRESEEHEEDNYCEDQWSTMSKKELLRKLQQAKKEIEKLEKEYKDLVMRRCIETFRDESGAMERAYNVARRRCKSNASLCRAIKKRRVDNSACGPIF